MILLRPARPADAPALARTHVAVWRRTYRDLAPQSAQDALDEARRLAFWTGALGDPARPGLILAAESGGAVIGFASGGFASGGPATEAVFAGRAEVKHLYVDDAHARRGIGRRLLAALCADLWAGGARGIGLGVVVGNDPAIAFYEAMGGRRHGRYTDPGPLWRSDNWLYVWDDPARLPPPPEGDGAA